MELSICRKRLSKTLSQASSDRCDSTGKDTPKASSLLHSKIYPQIHSTPDRKWFSVSDIAFRCCTTIYLFYYLLLTHPISVSTIGQKSARKNSIHEAKLKPQHDGYGLRPFYLHTYILWIQEEWRYIDDRSWTWSQSNQFSMDKNKHLSL